LLVLAIGVGQFRRGGRRLGGGLTAIASFGLVLLAISGDLRPAAAALGAGLMIVATEIDRPGELPRRLLAVAALGVGLSILAVIGLGMTLR